MSRILTKRKAAWVEIRKPRIIQGEAISPAAAVAARYYGAVAALIEEMTTDVTAELKAFFETGYVEEYFATDGPNEVLKNATTAAQARILTNALLKKFNSRFSRKAKVVADRFAREADKASSAAVHSSIQKLSGGLSLPTASLSPDMQEILSATATENINLIKSVSQKYLNEMQQAVMRSVSQGQGLPNLLPYLKKQKDISLRRAQLISMDQTRKVSSNMARARFQKLGLGKYKWLHTGGSDEPRELHIRMSGNIYSWDDPPIIDEKTGERGHPGTAIYCRCKPIPVIEFENEPATN